MARARLGRSGLRTARCGPWKGLGHRRYPRRHPMLPSGSARSACPTSPKTPAGIQTRTIGHSARAADHERICRPPCFHTGRRFFDKCSATAADRAHSHRSRRSHRITPGRRLHPDRSR